MGRRLGDARHKATTLATLTDTGKEQVCADLNDHADCAWKTVLGCRPGARGPACTWLSLCVDPGDRRRAPDALRARARAILTPLRDRAQQLEAENADLAGRERSAVLDLYALETRLARADRRVAVLRQRRRRDRRGGATTERASRSSGAASTRPRRAWRNAFAPSTSRAIQIRVEILLGARSLDEALTALDSLGRLARQRPGDRRRGAGGSESP